MDFLRQLVDGVAKAWGKLSLSARINIGLAFLGALSGDHAGYYFGRTLGPKFHQIGMIKKYQSGVARAEGLIRRHGSAAIFIGRFVPAIRSIIPALTGISGIERLRYSFVDALACLFWVLALAAILLGIDELV